MFIVLNREAPIGLGGRVNLNPGVNEVRPEDWEAVKGRKSTQFYVAAGIVVPHELKFVVVPREPQPEPETKSEELPKPQAEMETAAAEPPPAPPHSPAERPAPKRKRGRKK
jgi:hypothetical protein